MGASKRYLAGGISLLTLVVSMFVTDGTTAGAASLDTERSSSGPAGSTVRVTGNGYAPLLQVDICWDDQGCDDLGSTGAGLGSFSTTVTIPSDSDPGVYQIYACQLGGVLGGVTCASASFEVNANEPDTTTTTTTTLEATTTTAPPSTTRPSAPSTTEPGPTTTTTVGPPGSTATTTPPAAPTTPTDDNSEPPTIVVDDPTPPPTESAVSQVPVVATTPESTDETTAVQESAISPTAESYTPPTLADPDSTVPETDPDLPTLAVEQVEEAGEMNPAQTSMLSWLDDPLLFWAIWLAAVAVGGMVALAIAWLARRGRHQT